MKTSTPDDLHRQLGEFIQGCLSDVEAQRMNERITSDPQVARAYAAAKLEADWLAKAGKLSSSVYCSSDQDTCSTSAETGSCCTASQERTALSQWRKWLVFSAVALVLAIGYFAFAPTQATLDETGPLRLATELVPNKLSAGELAEVRVTLENVSGQSQPMTVVIVGLPEGLSPRYDQLDKLGAAGKFNSYELRGGELAFYWRGIAAQSRGDEAIRFTFDVLAERPSRSTAAASRTYLVYAPKKKHWAQPLAVEIAR